MGIAHWNSSRCKLGDIPPAGWPLQVTLAKIVAISIIISIGIGYATCVFTSKNKTNKNLKSTCLLSSDANNDDSLSFDGDTKSIVVDNLANCIIWKNKNSFIQKSYIKLNAEDLPSISTASGSGIPTDIGEVPIG